MKFFTVLLLGFALQLSTLTAQVIDTVFYENFEVAPDVPWSIIPIGDDTSWVNLDADGLTPYDMDDNHYAWYFSTDFHSPPDSITGLENGVMASLSYMDGFAPGNRNWLIMPPITIDDDSYAIHWKSAAFQLPRYMDGYSVLVSTTNNDVFATDFPFTDTIFQAASMDAITGDGQSIVLSNFSFTPGYIHANNLTNWDYIDIWAEGDSALLRGFLEPHSFNLSAYVGKTIYVAFLHDSDDDYFLELDDILVTRSIGSNTQSPDALDLRLTTYPNPVDRQLNVLFRLDETAPVRLRVSDMQGKIVREVLNDQSLNAGEHSYQIQLTDLPAGAYTLQLQVQGAMQSKVFTKR